MFDEILMVVYLILVGALFGAVIKDVSLDKIRLDEIKGNIILDFNGKKIDLRKVDYFRWYMI